MTLKLDVATLRLLAVESESDPRSVAKRIRGETVRGLAGIRIDRVLTAHGLKPQSAPQDLEVRP